MLHRAIYVSDAVGASGASLLSIAQILGVAESNNRRDHINSMMVFHQGQFMQAMEGARSDLDRLLRRLRADPRHNNLRFLLDGAVDGRLLACLPMARVAVETDVADAIGSSRLDQLTRAQAEHLFGQKAVALAA